MLGAVCCCNFAVNTADGLILLKFFLYLTEFHPVGGAMTSVKLRKERVGAVDYDTQIKEMRCQLLDQLKVLDAQLEQKTQQLQDMADYLRRRGEIENEYSRSLEKLAERFTLRRFIGEREREKEPSSHSVSVSQVWLALLSQTRQESRDHSGLSESCSNFLITPVMHCLDYTQRLAKKSRDLCTQLQDGLLKVTTELTCLCLCAGMADLPPVPLRVCLCRGEAEGGREAGGKAKAECG
uniref:Rho GTPase activating protein 4a n=1 Tax=Poecilia reticulata TaxID=8081 RepID=A0A3P9QFS3_POERE